MRFFNIQNIELIDFKALVRMLPGRRMWNPFSTQGGYISAMLRSQSVLERYGIDNALRLAHFIGQGLIETGFLRYKAENLNYSTDALLRVFPKYFADRAEAKTYARKPEKIANRVYANRMGNGDETSGDGWRYRGRGFFQLTGKNNYQRYGDLASIDLVGNPSVIEKDLKTSIEVAAAFFGKTGLGEYADKNDAAAVSRGVNRGNPKSRFRAHGEDERIVWTRKALALVKDPDQILTSDSAAADDGVYDVGDSGDEVKSFQRKLKQLGFDVGRADGIYGRNTRRAVVAFQDEYGVPITGKIDAETADAIDEALEDTRRLQSVERQTATASDMRSGGARDISKTGQAGTAGAAAGGAGAVAIGNETGVLETVVEEAQEILSPPDTPLESSQVPPSSDQISQEVETNETNLEADESSATSEESTAELETGDGENDEANSEILTQSAETPQGDTSGEAIEGSGSAEQLQVEEIDVPETPGDDPEPNIQPPIDVANPELATESAIEQTPPLTSQPAESDINWTTVAILLLIVVIGVFIFVRSRQAVADRMDEYRSS